MEPKIAPSVIAADFTRLAEEVRAVERAGADLIHVDVMDGRFVPNLTFGPMLVAAMRRATALPLDVHLMIVEPERYLDDFIKAGATGLTVHYEACVHLDRTVHLIRERGAKAGVAINPATPAGVLEYVVPLVDLVLVMTVNPGWGGQQFIRGVVPKIAAVRRMVEEAGAFADVEVDGGVALTNAAEVTRAGASILVSGTGIFHTDDYAATIRAMRQRAAEATSHDIGA